MLYAKKVTLVFLVQLVCAFAFVVYCTLIVVNFAQMFYENLTLIQRRHTSEGWLQEKCTEPEFVHHLKNHNLCDLVERDALKNAYLSAMQLALDGLHLCGSYSCEKIFIAVTESLHLSIYTWIASLAIILVMLPVCVLPLYRKWQRSLLLHENHLADNQMVPSVYIRDQVSNMTDIPMRNMHILSNCASSHFNTEARHRNVIGNGTDTTHKNQNSTYMSGGNQYAYTNQSRYPLHDHQH